MKKQATIQSATDMYGDMYVLTDEIDDVSYVHISQQNRDTGMLLNTQDAFFMARELLRFVATEGMKELDAIRDIATHLKGSSQAVVKDLSSLKKAVDNLNQSEVPLGIIFNAGGNLRAMAKSTIMGKPKGSVQ